MIHKTFIKLDSIDTFMPIMKYPFIFIQSITYSYCTINETHQVLSVPLLLLTEFAKLPNFLKKEAWSSEDPILIQWRKMTNFAWKKKKKNRINIWISDTYLPNFGIMSPNLHGLKGTLMQIWRSLPICLCTYKINTLKISHSYF